MSLKNQNRLPHLRTDIKYFINNSANYKIYYNPENIKNLKKKFKKYIFPRNYSCVYYRHLHPEFINGNYHVRNFK